MVHLRSATETKVWRIQQDPHYQTSKSASNRDSKNPRDAKKTDSLPVDCSEAAVAQTNTDSGTGDAHRSRDWKLEMGKHEDGNSGAHLH